MLLEDLFQRIHAREFLGCDPDEVLPIIEFYGVKGIFDALCQWCHVGKNIDGCVWDFIYSAINTRNDSLSAMLYDLIVPSCLTEQLIDEFVGGSWKGRDIASSFIRAIPVPMGFDAVREYFCKQAESDPMVVPNLLDVLFTHQVCGLDTCKLCVERIVNSRSFFLRWMGTYYLRSENNAQGPTENEWERKAVETLKEDPHPMVKLNIRVQYDDNEVTANMARLLTSDMSRLELLSDQLDLRMTVEKHKIEFDYFRRFVCNYLESGRHSHYDESLLKDLYEIYILRICYFIEKFEFTCPCCGYIDASGRNGLFATCRICSWMDDPRQLINPDLENLANINSLRQAQAKFDSTSIPAIPMKLKRNPKWYPISESHNRQSFANKDLDLISCATLPIEELCYWMVQDIE